MRRSIVAAAAVLALIPAVAGVWGNESFSQDVPVRVPNGPIEIVAEDDDDMPTPTSSPSHAEDDAPKPAAPSTTAREDSPSDGDERDGDVGAVPGHDDRASDNDGAGDDAEDSENGQDSEDAVDREDSEDAEDSEDRKDQESQHSESHRDSASATPEQDSSTDT